MVAIPSSQTLTGFNFTSYEKVLVISGLLLKAAIQNSQLPNLTGIALDITTEGTGADIASSALFTVTFNLNQQMISQAGEDVLDATLPLAPGSCPAWTAAACPQGTAVAGYGIETIPDTLTYLEQLFVWAAQKLWQRLAAANSPYQERITFTFKKTITNVLTLTIAADIPIDYQVYLNTNNLSCALRFIALGTVTPPVEVPTTFNVLTENIVYYVSPTGNALVSGLDVNAPASVESVRSRIALTVQNGNSITVQFAAGSYASVDLPKSVDGGNIRFIGNVDSPIANIQVQEITGQWAFNDYFIDWLTVGTADTNGITLNHCRTVFIGTIHSTSAKTVISLENSEIIDIGTIELAVDPEIVLSGIKQSVIAAYALTVNTLTATRNVTNAFIVLNDWSVARFDSTVTVTGTVTGTQARVGFASSISDTDLVATIIPGDGGVAWNDDWESMDRTFQPQAFIRYNYGSDSNPTVNNDATSGYSWGSRWLNTTTHNEFVCLDPSAGAAIWKQTT